MKIFVVTTAGPKYKKMTATCVKSVKHWGYEIERFESVTKTKDTLTKVAKELGTFLKYSDSGSDTKTLFPQRKCPLKRISNGLTHYQIYKWSYENNTPVCILEADATLIGELPEPIHDGIIQVSSHKLDQMTVRSLFYSGRSVKMKNWAPEKYEVWKEQFDWNCLEGAEGVIKHPCTGTIGTSGYIVGPAAAKRLLDYFTKDGIGFADRVREDHIGLGNLYLQVPQSVIVKRHGPQDRTNRRNKNKEKSKKKESDKQEESKSKVVGKKPEKRGKCKLPYS